MGVRDPGNKPQTNDRIPYVFVKTKKKAKLQGDKVEHPDYVIKNGLKLDFLTYIVNQIMKPCIQFLELITYNPDDIFKDYIIKEENMQKGIAPINSFLDNDNNNNENKKNINFDINDDDLIDFSLNMKKPVDISNINSTIKKKTIKKKVNNINRVTKIKKIKKEKVDHKDIFFDL